MRTIITARTASATSEAFSVRPGQVTSVVADGLAGAEEMTIQIKNSLGDFQDISESTAVLTATTPQRTISASGDYKVVKDATAGLSGCCIGELS
jgi:hypothetical protein